MISLLIGFLSGCVSGLPAIFSKPDVFEVYNVLNKYYYKDLDFKLSDVESVEDILARLDDPYTYMYAPNSRSIELGEYYYGIGISIIEDEKGMLISDVNKDANIERLIYIGDIITEIDGTSLVGLAFDEKTAKLVGNLGDQFTLTIERGDRTITETVTIKEIPLNSVTSRKIGQIGYIDINRFAGTTGQLFKTELSNLETEGINGLIIDVRDNGGGYLNAVVDILKQFMSDKKTPFLTMERVYDNRLAPYYPLLEKERKAYPIVVLINENSASASEVLAAAMQEYEGYDLIGKKTFGKFVYQVTVELKNQGKEAYLNFTEGYWLTPSNQKVEGGILPTIEVSALPLFDMPYPMYNKELKVGDDLGDYKTLLEILSLHINDLNTATLLFDETLENQIETYQNQVGIEMTGTLNYETTLHLIDHYNFLLKNNIYDLQLDQAILYFQ